MMEFGPKRGHFLYIFEDFFKNFGLLIIALIAGFMKGDIASAIEENIGIAVIVLIMPIGNILSYLRTTIHVTPLKIVVASGILNQRTVEIPAASITTIDYTQNILQQFFHVYRMKIDNAGNMSVENQANVIQIVLSQKDAELVTEILGKKESFRDGVNLAGSSDENTGKNRTVMIPEKSIFLMGLLKSKLLMMAEGFGILSAIIAIVPDDFFPEDSFLGRDLDLTLLGTWLVVGGILLVFALVIFAAGIIVTLIRYSNFTISDREDSIVIEYGLLTRKKYTLVKSRISGFSYEQSFLMRKMKKGILKVYAVGFGGDIEDGNEMSILHPYLSEENVRDFMGEYTDVFSEECHMMRRADHSLRYFFYRPVFILLSLFFIICIVLFAMIGQPQKFWWILALGFALPAFSAAGRIMESRNTAIGGNERELVLSVGGYTKNTAFLKMEQVESLITKGSIWKRKKGIVNLQVDFLGAQLMSSETVCNVAEEAAEELERYLVF